MKKFIILLALMISTHSHAGFISSEPFYQLAQRLTHNVDNSGDITIDLKIERHGNFVDVDRYVEVSINRWTGLTRADKTKVRKGKGETRKVVSLLDPHLDAFYCTALDTEYSEYYKDEDCRENLFALLGNSVTEADDIRVLFIEGDYYDGYAFMEVILSDFETKETARLTFPLYHDI